MCCSVVACFYWPCVPPQRVLTSGIAKWIILRSSWPSLEFVSLCSSNKLGVFEQKLDSGMQISWFKLDLNFLISQLFRLQAVVSLLLGLTILVSDLTYDPKVCVSFCKLLVPFLFFLLQLWPVKRNRFRNKRYENSTVTLILWRN